MGLPILQREFKPVGAPIDSLYDALIEVGNHAPLVPAPVLDEVPKGDVVGESPADFVLEAVQRERARRVCDM